LIRRFSACATSKFKELAQKCHVGHVLVTLVDHDGIEQAKTCNNHQNIL
jgi:hypothetical protein